ncbi:MAG: UTP--glucose-1-phosphate uridylyltransferase [Nocardioidaceae bacterium]
MSAEGLERARQIMAAASVPARAVDVFAHYYAQLEQGATGTIDEADVSPLTDPTQLADLPHTPDERDAFARTAVIRLNGGLGTSMGLHRAKSLLTVRDDLTFLDLIVRQVLSARAALDVPLPLLFMNSFRTREDTLDALAAYPHLPVAGLPVDFLQNQEPKLRTDDLMPVRWPSDPSLEWCPPGHGDLYTALEVSGVLSALVDAGFRYASVSNSDNLGATPDPAIASWFAHSGAPYAAEVCRRTPADRKGGHLVVRKSDGRLVLRDSAQIRPEDADAAADTERHPYFHTNNLWLDLTAVARALEERDGVLGLPLIRNVKTVDPTDDTSPEVVQIETAMGAAVEVFEGARAIAVPRSRFLPVKTTDDLLLTRSDVYELRADHTLRPMVDEAPLVRLDPTYFGKVGDFEPRVSAGVPSMVGAVALDVHGDWTFGPRVTVQGRVELEDQGRPSTVAEGTVLSG